MNCIIVDDEPLARKGLKILIDEIPQLFLTGCFNNPLSASQFMQFEKVDLVFLDIRMPEANGIDFARTISRNTLVIFVTAYAEYAIDSYEVEAIDYLLKPVDEERFKKAVEKARVYLQMLSKKNIDPVEAITDDYVFVKADRRFVKIYFSDIKYVEALKDYIIIHTDNQRVITRMNLKAIQDQLPSSVFTRVSKSYIINTKQVTSADNNSVMIGSHEILIGNNFREEFFNNFIAKKILISNK